MFTLETAIRRSQRLLVQLALNQCRRGYSLGQRFPPPPNMKTLARYLRAVRSYNAEGSLIQSLSLELFNRGVALRDGIPKFREYRKKAARWTSTTTAWSSERGVIVRETNV